MNKKYLVAYIMLPETKLKVQNILLIIGLGLCFGMLYNYLFYPHTLTEFLEAGIVSILIGLIVGIWEEFVFKKAFQSIALLYVIFIRSILYSLFTSIVLCLVLSIEIAFTENISYIEAVILYLESPLFQRDFLFSFFFILLMLFIVEVILLIGKANFFRLLFGLYHKPREVSRIFMFVDLKNSTSIAETLPNKQFSAFIKDFFYDLSDAIMMYRGEVYQYVGDEITVIWPIRTSKTDCIDCFFKMIDIIERKRNSYLTKYGVVPEFKAGIHSGQVIVTSVGRQKKEIVYHGDVLNTASRMVGKCRELNQELLISEDLLRDLPSVNGFIIEEKGDIQLRGKAHKLKLHGVIGRIKDKG